jgi:hypothetical protein
MKRKTRATPANTPRSRSKLTRRQRIYGYRVHKPEDRNPENLKWMYCKLPVKQYFEMFLPPSHSPIQVRKSAFLEPIGDICTVTPMENQQ